MVEPVRIEVESEAQALDLSRALAVRGLNGALLFDGLRWAVELRYVHEQTRHLLAEVSEAVLDWLADRGHESVTVRMDDRTFLLRPARTQALAGTGAGLTSAA